MKTTAELQVIPIGDGVSVRHEVKQVIEILGNYNLILDTHASGTNIEGDMDEVFSAVSDIHNALHKAGTVRLLSYLKLETRTDKIPTLAGKKI